MTRDSPSRFGSTPHLEGQELIPELDIFIAQSRPSLAFLIFENYDCCVAGEDQPYTKQDSLIIPSHEFAQHLTEFTKALGKDEKFFPPFNLDDELDAPFLWYYHCLPEIREQVKTLSKGARHHIDLFQGYFEKCFNCV